MYAAAEWDRSELRVAKVTWRIEDFSLDVEQKEKLFSELFCVQTVAGECQLQLVLTFCRKAGSTRQGFVGFVCGT